MVTVVSQITMLPLRSQDDRTKHVMYFRRQARVVLPPSNAERTLNIVLKLKINNHDYRVYITTDTLKCFECGNFGHLKRSTHLALEGKKQHALSPGLVICFNKEEWLETLAQVHM